MPLEKAFIEEMRGRLEEEKVRLEADLSRLGKKVGEGDYETSFRDMGSDEDENASEVEQYIDDKALEDNLENQLRDVSDALGRIAAGTYGICEKTGSEISPERLRAYPAARTALE